MLRKICFLASLIAVALAGSSAQADTFFSLRANVPNQGGGFSAPNTRTVQGSALGGYSYANQVTGAIGLPTGGEIVRTVTADVITGFTTNPGGTFTSADVFGNNQKVVAVFAGQGVVSVNMGISTVTFTQGVLSLYVSPRDPNVPSTLFNPSDPSTWGTGGAPLATFSLIGPENITPGNPFADGSAFLASQVNNISLNTLAPQQAQGRFLFQDVVDPLINVSDPLPPGFFAILEGLWGTIEETLDNTPDPLSLANLAILNAIAAAAGLSDLDGVTPGNQAFATGLGNGVNTDFFPNNGVGPGATGDFQFTLGASFVPGVLARQIEIPEPASIAVWGVGMGIAGLMAARRRRKTA